MGVIILDKNVLVCTANRRNTRKLTERGEKIAKTYGGKCYVLTVTEHPYDEKDFNDYSNKKELETILSSYDTELIYESKNNRKLCETIADVTEKLDVGHIIIGHPVRTRWDVLTEGSLINELFSELDDVDLHIVEVSKETAKVVESDYELGVEMNLLDFKGDLATIVGTENLKDVKGIFYQNKSTEFVNGIFKVKELVGNDYSDVLYKVSDGEIIKNTGE